MGAWGCSGCSGSAFALQRTSKFQPARVARAAFVFLNFGFAHVAPISLFLSRVLPPEHTERRSVRAPLPPTPRQGRLAPPSFLPQVSQSAVGSGPRTATVRDRSRLPGGSDFTSLPDRLPPLPLRCRPPCLRPGPPVNPAAISLCCCAAVLLRGVAGLSA